MEIKDIRRNNLLALLTRFESIRQFADGTGVPAAYVSQIKNEADGRGMGSKTARKIEASLNLPVGYMDQVQVAEQGAPADRDPAMGKGEKTAGAPADHAAGQDTDEELQAFADSDFQRLPRGRQVPVVGQAQGGPDGYISIHDYPPDQGDGWIIMPTRDPSAYGLRVRGDSMRPRIKSGEFILVEPSFEAQPGDDVVVKFRDGSAVAKELLWVRDDEVCLGSINNGVPPMTRPLESVQTIHRIAAIIPRGSPFHVPSA